MQEIISNPSSSETLGRPQLLSLSSPLPTALRVLYPVLLFMSIVSPVDASAITSTKAEIYKPLAVLLKGAEELEFNCEKCNRNENQGKCFNLPYGLSINGGEYRRVRGVTLRECAEECREDSSCLAYEYHKVIEICYLKSRSLSGELEKKEETSIGFCLDENDEARDRFLDHIATGPVIAEKTGVEGDDCRDFCMMTEGVTIYSFVPEDVEDDDSTIGTCTCIEAIRGLNLMFNAFSGILPPKRHPRRIKF